MCPQLRLIPLSDKHEKKGFWCEVRGALRNIIACGLLVALCWVASNNCSGADPPGGATGERRSAELLRLSGLSEEVRLLAIDDVGVTFRFARDDGQATPEVSRLPMREVVRWGTRRDPTEVDQLLLSDGSIMVGHVTDISRESLRLTTDYWGELVFPRRVVVGIVWSLPTKLVERWKLRDSLLSDAKRDHLRLNNGDILTGRLVSADLKQARNFRFALASSELSVPADSVAAWQTSVGLDKGVGARLILGMSDGSRLAADKVALSETMQVKLGCGPSLTLESHIRPVAEGLVCFLQPVSDDVRFLSDLNPLGHRHIPFLATKWDWGADRNVLGGPIAIDRGILDRGIGMHSTARLAFDMPAGFDEFQSELAIDRSAGLQGSVVYRVFTSSSGSDWQESYRSPVIRGGEQPTHVRVDVRGVRRMALVVDFADAADVMDRANWLDARLIRRQ